MRAESKSTELRRTREPGPILIVEDDRAVLDMLSFCLQRRGYSVVAASDLAVARQHLEQRGPRLLLVDWMLGHESGLDLVLEMRGKSVNHRLPIIMLSGRADDLDKARALDSGADDYVSKPFSPRELLARISRLLRPKFVVPDAVTEGPLKLDPAHRTVSAGGTCIELAPKDFQLLQFLSQHSERVHSRSSLLANVWETESVRLEERTVDVQILRLRKALREIDCARLIQTVRGVGYRFSIKM